MKRLVTAFVMLTLFGFVSTALAATGAIWTTDSTCGGVNINLFALKADVYLNGGPQGGGGGLPDGNYYVQVTDPSGSQVLGKTLGATAIVANGAFVSCYQLVDILYSFSSGFTVKGYDDTPNNGGEYKVWASKDADFTGGTNKTDNFKVEESGGGGGTGEDEGSISGFKFLDSNVDTEFVDEPGIEGWRIELWRYTGVGIPATCAGEDWLLEATTYTDGDGYYFFDELDIPAYYKVVEIFPGDNDCGDWEATTDTCHIIILTEEPYIAENQDFGNVCYNTGGLTIGYWKTHAGYSKGAEEDPLYDSGIFPIFLGDGGCYKTINTARDAYDVFVAAKANDTGKKMLAAQLLGTKLNILEFTDCAFGTAIYIGNIEAFEGMTVEEIVALADALLCDASASKAAVAEMIKVLDQINNNGHEPRVLVNSEPCPVEYPEELLP